jgi:hypothetical protein
MKDWQSNKSVHDKYWSNLFKYLDSESLDIDIISEWLNIFKFELGNPDYIDYILDGKVVSGNFSQYAKDKNEYLQNRLDKYVTPTTDAILDLGSGWGRHSIQLSFNNPNYPLIISGELSDAGREITNYFKEKYKLPIEVFKFNWHDHQSLIDLLLNKKFNEIVIFTSNTIEQIPYIDEKLFIDIINLPIDKISVIHIEPVAFQYNSEPFPFNNHYNRNLKHVLDSLASKGLIEIKTVIPQYYGHTTNTTSKNNILIEWIKK